MITHFLHTVHRFMNSLFCRNQRYMEEYAVIRSYARATAVNVHYSSFYQSKCFFSLCHIQFLQMLDCFCVKQKMHFIWHFNNPPEQQGALGITLL